MKLNGALPFTAGVEIEFALRGHEGCRPSYGSSVYTNELQKVNTALREHNLSDRWKCVIDYSCGLEVVSTPFATMADLEEISSVINMLVSMGFKTDAACGLHIHVGGFRNDTAALKRIAHFMHRYQDAFYLLAGPSRQSNTFCKKNREQIAAFRRDPEGFLAQYNSSVRYNDQRYGWINFHALTKHGTVELRLPESELKVRHVINWVKFTLMLFETVVAKGKNVRWGTATAQSKAILLNTLLEQAGIRDADNDRSLRLSIKNWALKRASTLHHDFSVRRDMPAAPTASTPPGWIAPAGQNTNRTIDTMASDMQTMLDAANAVSNAASNAPVQRVRLRRLSRSRSRRG